MLSKIIVTGLFVLALSVPTDVEAHPRHNHAKPSPQHSVVNVSIGWNWVNATFLHRGYWQHPHYGRSHRSIHVGPPPSRPQASAVWVPGHWVRHGHHKRWVSGRWVLR